MTTDPFTEAARAEAERRWPRGQADGHGLPGHARMSRRIGFEIGALWAAEQEPTDGERAVRELHGQAWNGTLDYCRRCLDYEGAIYPCSTIQALDSARAARRDDTSTTPAHRILNLHAADADGNCTHCTRGRVYPVPAPCETVRALAGGGEGR